MKVLRVYQAANCSTCKKALKFLTNQRLAVEKVDIFANPPSLAELKQMLTFLGGNFYKLFNTSGREYYARGLKEDLSEASAEQALKLLASDGRLIKRPFLLLPNAGLVGFDEKEWRRFLADPSAS